MTLISKISYNLNWRLSGMLRDGCETRVLSLTGRLDAEAAGMLRGPIEELARDMSSDIVLNLAGISYLDGSGLAIIGYLFKRLVASGRCLRVAGASGQPRKMLAGLGLHGMLAQVSPEILHMQAGGAVLLSSTP
jgi:anti-anti-sigma factor